MKQKQGFYSNLFDEEFERISIDRIKRFYKLAFQDLIQLVQNDSGYSSVIFEDGTIGKVVEAMGGYDMVS